jgi:hypothetical protein
MRKLPSASTQGTRINVPVARISISSDAIGALSCFRAPWQLPPALRFA